MQRDRDELVDGPYRRDFLTYDNHILDGDIFLQVSTIDVFEKKLSKHLSTVKFVLVLYSELRIFILEWQKIKMMLSTSLIVIML